MNIEKDKRIVLTLDAGGTNFVFNAIQGCEKVTEEIRLPSNADNLDKCLATIVEGFNLIKENIESPPVAISFAFPGPADYPNGIIGDLPNLPAFRGGVALGPMLQEKFELPVFINNDGDLYAYGEAIAGFLPYVNNLLEKAGSVKRYKNLLGLTLGTGFGASIVSNGNLFTGDNSIAGEIWLMRDKLSPSSNVEVHGSIKGVKNTYAKEINTDFKNSPEPKDIYEIAIGQKDGNKAAAIKSFKDLAVAAGDAIAHAVTLIDGLVVIGGGLSGASDLYLPFLVEEMNSHFTSSIDGSRFPRLVADVYNLENQDELDKFIIGETKEITIYGTDKKIKYDPRMRIGVGISKIGTSNAISIGAYAYALNKIDGK